MNDLLYGRSLNVFVGLLLLVVAYVYMRVVRRYRADALVRMAAAVVAVPTLGALVIFQIHLFKAVTGVSRPLHSDAVFFATLAFGFTVRGSWLSVALMTILGGFTFSGIGLLVAARPTTIEGVSGLMNFIMLPMWLLSGTFFSSERFPQILQPFIQALPLTALNNVLRALMNEGTTLSSNWLPIAILLAWCVVSFVVALKIFKWQ